MIGRDDEAITGSVQSVISRGAVKLPDAIKDEIENLRALTSVLRPLLHAMRTPLEADDSENHCVYRVHDKSEYQPCWGLLQCLGATVS